MKFFLFLGAFGIATWTVDAQSILTPSKKSFEKKWLKNQEYQMKWYAMKDTSAFEIGKVTTQVSTNNAQLTVVTQVQMNKMNAPWVDTSVAEIKTLKPIRHSSYNMQRDMVLNFGKIVTGFYNDKMKKNNIVVHDTTRTAYFDSNLYPILLGWLPLREGYQRDIAIYDYNPSGKIGVIKASVTAVKNGRYTTEKSGVRAVWIVSVSDEIGSGDNGTSTFYFDQTDRKLWKQEMNANGRKMMMKLVE